MNNIPRRPQRKRKGKGKLPPLPIPPMPPPPPPPPPEQWSDGLVIIVRILSSSDVNAGFLRFNIPTATFNYLVKAVKSDISSGIISYIRHRHDHSRDPNRFFNYSLDPVLNGPFSSQISRFCSTCSVSSVVYALGDNCRYSIHEATAAANKPPTDCHRLRYCDFSSKIPTWKTTLPLTYHRFQPTMEAVDDMLFIFEGFPTEFPWGLMFDTCDGSCSDIPSSAFHKDVDDFILASLGRKLLLVDKTSETQYCYDTLKSAAWMSYDAPPGFYDHISGIRMTTVPVSEINTLYWLDQSGDIRAFNWVTLKMFEGPLVGFGSEFNLKDVDRSWVSLLYLSFELFCLVWCDPSDTLHLTILRICLDDTPDTSTVVSPYPLTASVVACFCYRLNYRAIVRATHLLSSTCLGDD